MSRVLEQVKEERETARRNALVAALEYKLPGTLETQGITLTGFAVKYDAYECLMTIKADIGGARHVSFVGGGSVMDCIIKSVRAAEADRLRWKEDIYKPSAT